MSRSVSPREYSETASSSKPGRRVCRLAADCGSKLPLRSRGTVTSSAPWPVSTRLVPWPLRLLPLPRPAASCLE